MSKIRISKYLSTRNFCSRREAEKLIEKGEVKVNGSIIKTPVFFVTEEDVVEFKNIVVNNTKQEKKIWMYYKPVGEITTHKDPQGRPTVFESIRKKGIGRVVSVGRLDINSEGLLLLTNESFIAHNLEKPSKKILRKYKVRIFGNINNDIWKEFYGKARIDGKRLIFSNLEIEGFRYAPISLEFEGKNPTTLPTTSSKNKNDKEKNFWCYVELIEGKNREIRKIMNFLNWQVNRLIRISYGPFDLNNLKPGEVREIKNFEEILKSHQLLPNS